MASGARSGRTLAVWLLVLAVLAVVAFGVITKRQEIQDRLDALGYEPSARVTAVIQKLQLTEAGEVIFLASHPTVESSQRFNRQCQDVTHSDDGHVLGCFTGDRIHLFEVGEERLSGVVEVTAAHELLHAAYARLSAGEREHLTPLLESAYADVASADPAFKERMSLYSHLGRASFANELHSILGTEVAQLPPELEEHYARWFADRRAVTTLFAQYHGVFVELQAKATELEGQMSALADEIDARSAEYTAQLAAYNEDVRLFKERNANYEFSDVPWVFEQIRAELGERRDQLEADRASLNAEIDRYNGLRDELAGVSETSAELDRTIDSSLAPPDQE